MFISHDLIRSIISYLSTADFEDLRNVSPVVDREICASGIRIVSYRKKYYDLVSTNAMIIQFESGKKEALILRDGIYKTIDDECRINTVSMSITQYSGQVHEYIHIDKNSKIGVSYNNNVYNYYCFDSRSQMESAGKYVYHQKLSYGIIGTIDYVDFDTRCAIQDVQNDWQYIERFTVIFQAGQWT